MTGAVSPFVSPAQMIALLPCWKTARAFERWAAKHGIFPFVCDRKRVYDRDVVMGRFVNPITQQPARLSTSMSTRSLMASGRASQSSLPERVS